VSNGHRDGCCCAVCNWSDTSSELVQLRAHVDSLRALVRELVDALLFYSEIGNEDADISHPRRVIQLVARARAALGTK
jgi:hypothetical protein